LSLATRSVVDANSLSRPCETLSGTDVFRIPLAERSDDPWQATSRA
jgi:hypothetical protein